MNSLSDLNNFNSQGLPYSDPRPFTITFSNSTPINQSITLVEGQSHSVQVGTDITTLRSTTANTINYIVDLSSVSNASVQWSSIPSTSTLISYPNNVHKITNIVNVTGWNQVKSPIITMPRDSEENFTYTCSITYPTNLTKTWTSNITVTSTGEMTSPSSINYDEDVSKIIDSYPQIIDTESDGLYTLVLAPNTASAIRSLSSAGTGGTSSFNNTTKALTISGLRAQVNSHLSSITLATAVDYSSNFSLTYSLTNPSSGVNTQVSQLVLINDINAEINNMGVTRSYTENESELIFTSSIPYIGEDTDEIYDIEFVLTDAIGKFGLTESDSNWNAGTKTYSYSGTQDEINSLFETIKFYPVLSSYANSTVTYKQYKYGTLSTSVSFSLNGIASTYYPQIRTGFYKYNGSYDLQSNANVAITTMYAHEHPYFRAWAWTDANLIQNPQVNVAIYTNNSISPTQLSANVIDVTSSAGFLTSQYNTKSIILHNEFVDTASNISDWSNRRQEYITTVANISRGAYTWTSTSNAQVRYRQDYIGVSSSLYVGGSGSDYYYTGWTSRGTTWSGITDSDGIYSVDHNVAHDSLWNPYYRINFDIDHYASGDWSNKEIMIKKCGVKVTGNASFSSDTLTATFDTYASYPTLDYDLSNTQIKNSNDVLSSSLLFLGVVENSSSMNNAPWYTGNYAGDILEKRDAFYLNGQWYSGWYSDPTQLNITSRLSDSGWQSTRPVVTLAMPMYGIKFPTGVTNVKMFYKLRFGYYKASSSSSTPVYTLVDGPTLVFNYNVS